MQGIDSSDLRQFKKMCGLCEAMEEIFYALQNIFVHDCEALKPITRIDACIAIYLKPVILQNEIIIENNALMINDTFTFQGF